MIKSKKKPASKRKRKMNGNTMMRRSLKRKRFPRPKERPKKMKTFLTM
jgi:hypothetical protein